MVMPGDDSAHMKSMLRRIGRRVFDDVRMTRRTRIFAGTAVAALTAAAATGWVAGVHSGWISRVAITLYLLTCAISSVALYRRRFRWCCASTYVGAVSTVAGLGVVWWHQTAPPALSAGPAAWMVVGFVACATLTVTWLSVILTPLERSQPDMRLASAAGTD